MALPELHPVFEKWFDGSQRWVWPIASREDLSLIRLSGETSETEVGSFVAQLFKYNQLQSDMTVEGTLAAILAEESLLLPGGVQAIDGERVLNPGCCCGLESWRDWLNLFGSGVQPWTGHDPSPWVERSGDTFRFWSDGGMDVEPDVFAIDFPAARFVEQLEQIERKLQAFLPLVEQWARSIGFSNPAGLRDKVDTCFAITKRRPG